MDRDLKEIRDLPYTISYVIRKRLQVDSLNELPEEKRPTDSIIWDGRPEDIGKWLKEVFQHKRVKTSEIVIKSDEIEG